MVIIVCHLLVPLVGVFKGMNVDGRHIWRPIFTTFAAVMALVIAGVSGDKCPGRPSCSGHGKCIRDTCYCNNSTETHLDTITTVAAWMGGDCSLRTCPQARRWVAGKNNPDNAWEYFAECSGVGNCNRETGICECFGGFTGKGCVRDKRMCFFDAENNHYCSGHGDCITVFEQLIKIRRDSSTDLNEGMQDYNIRFTPNIGANQERSWDPRNTYVCDCNGIYFGAKCEKKACMSIGDDVDPLWRNSWDRIANSPGDHPEGHFQGRECSGRGECDYTEGECSCYKGFSGNKCQNIDFSYLDVGNPNSVHENRHDTGHGGPDFDDREIVYNENWGRYN